MTHIYLTSTIGLPLSPIDSAICREIDWQQSNRISIAAFDQRRLVDPDRMSFHRAARRIEELGSLTSEVYDCCLNSCVAYTGSYAALASCPLCSLARHHAGTMKARKTFEVIGIEDRLRAALANKSISQQLRHARGEGQEADFDGGDAFRTLCADEPANTFTVFVSASLDGYLLFKQ